MKRLFDNRATMKMKERNMTYSQLTQKLNLKGYELVPVEVFDIMRKRKRASRKMQEDIADILGCLRKDIF